MRKTAVGILLLCAGVVAAQESPSPAGKAGTPEALKAEIDSLKATRIAWREITDGDMRLAGLAFGG